MFPIAALTRNKTTYSCFVHLWLRLFTKPYADINWLPDIAVDEAGRRCRRRCDAKKIENTREPTIPGFRVLTANFIFFSHLKKNHYDEVGRCCSLSMSNLPIDLSSKNSIISMLYLTVPTGFYPRSRLSRESGRSPVILSSFFLPINPCYYSTVHMCPFQNSFVQITYPTWDCHCCRWFQTAKFLLLSYSLSLWCFSFFFAWFYVGSANILFSTPLIWCECDWFLSRCIIIADGDTQQVSTDPSPLMWMTMSISHRAETLGLLLDPDFHAGPAVSLSASGYHGSNHSSLIRP